MLSPVPNEAEECSQPDSLKDFVFGIIVDLEESDVK
jgi:hypothetical protein